MAKYLRAKDGEWVRPKMRGFKFCCCDCGLIHVMDFKVIQWGRGYRVMFKVKRDNRATAAARRGKVEEKRVPLKNP